MDWIICAAAFVLGYCVRTSGNARKDAGHKPELYMEHTHGGEP